MGAIYEAFKSLHNLPPMIKGSLVRHERSRKKDKGWSTKLSYKTYQKLKMEGKVE